MVWKCYRLNRQRYDYRMTMYGTILEIANESTAYEQSPPSYSPLLTIYPHKLVLSALMLETEPGGTWLRDYSSVSLPVGFYTVSLLDNLPPKHATYHRHRHRRHRRWSDRAVYNKISVEPIRFWPTAATKVFSSL